MDHMNLSEVNNLCPDSPISISDFLSSVLLPKDITYTKYNYNQSQKSIDMAN